MCLNCNLVQIKNICLGPHPLPMLQIPLDVPDVNKHSTVLACEPRRSQRGPISSVCVTEGVFRFDGSLKSSPVSASLWPFLSLAFCLKKKKRDKSISLSVISHLGFQF